MNRTRFFRATGLLLCLFILLGLCACTKDKPPEDGAPEPAALNGTFLGEYGSLSFNGDGTTVTLDLTASGAEALALPYGETAANYVFLFHNEQWRYDKAETFRIILAEKPVSFRNALGQTDENTVAFYADAAGDQAVVFQKQP